MPTERPFPGEKFCFDKRTVLTMDNRRPGHQISTLEIKDEKRCGVLEIKDEVQKRRRR